MERTEKGAARVTAEAVSAKAAHSARLDELSLIVEKLTLEIEKYKKMETASEDAIDWPGHAISFEVKIGRLVEIAGTQFISLSISFDSRHCRRVEGQICWWLSKSSQLAAQPANRASRAEECGRYGHYFPTSA